MWILRNSGEKKFHKFGTFLCFICYLSLNKNAKVGLKKEKILIGSWLTKVVRYSRTQLNMLLTEINLLDPNYHRLTTG